MDETNHNYDKSLDNNEIISNEVLEAMGISMPVLQEIEDIVGRMPTIDELSTLLAMWHTQGDRQGLMAWLRGQPHAAQRHEYLENEQEPHSKSVREPRVKECISIARNLFSGTGQSLPPLGLHRGDAIYMVGDVSLFFSDSEYGRKYLHLVNDPVCNDTSEEARSYLALILDSLHAADKIFAHTVVATGGLFGTLLRCVSPQRLGFDILACREVRLDAFLFGESGARYLAFLDEPNEDFFLQKLTEARVNCCFLGRVTKGRILVDDMDFGPVSAFGK